MALYQGPMLSLAASREQQQRLAAAEQSRRTRITGAAPAPEREGIGLLGSILGASLIAMHWLVGLFRGAPITWP